MSRYLLDTNALSHVLREPAGKVGQRMMAADPATLCTSIIVAAELRYGCARRGSKRLTDAVEALLASIPVLSLAIPADMTYGSIRAQLEADGQPIGGNDTLIAAHALAIGATLVTANVAEFTRVQGLAVENWQENAA